MKKLHRVFAFIPIAALLVASVICFSAASIYYSNGAYYTLINNYQASLTGWDTETSTVVAVPAELNGRRVTNIESYAFYNDSTIAAVDFSDAVNLNVIGMYAFSNCSALNSPVILPESIVEIDDCAFESSAVTEVDVNFSAKISDQCFNRCGNLTEVRINGEVTEIGTYAFANCPNLVAVYLPASVTMISNSAFYNDPNLTIYCYKDSYAHTYAEIKNIAYVLLDAEPQEYIYGDANSDGYVNISDVTDIQRAVAEIDTLDDLRKKAADVNGDGVVTIDDATILQMYLAEFATDYPISVVTAQ